MPRPILRPLNRQTAERIFPADRKARLDREHQARIEAGQTARAYHHGRNTEMTAIDRAKEAQRKLKQLGTELEMAIRGPDGTLTRIRTRLPRILAPAGRAAPAGSVTT